MDNIKPLLDEINNILLERGAKYGNFKDNFLETAQLWSVILGRDITIEEYSLCMIAVKINRLKTTPSHRDSWVDIIGYSLLSLQGLDEDENNI